MKVYIINRMYAGSYINDKLGGEFINLLHDDNNKNYIFINPSGFIDKKYDNKVEAIILTRIVKAGCFEILGIAKIAKNGQIIFQKGHTLKEKTKGNKKSSYFIFVPNYNKLDLKQYYGSKNYKIIRYNKIYDFFARNKVKDFYYREFVNALYKHTKDKEKDYAEEMAVRFLNQIKKNK